MINKIEALVDAVAYVRKAHQADSLAYQTRNPILLKSYSNPGKHAVNEEGIRIFDSYLGGYKSAVFDIQKKVSGTSNSGLKPTDKVKNLLNVLSVKDEQDQMLVIYFLRKALDKNIDLTTDLKYFIQ